MLGGGALINMHVANGGYLRHVIGYEKEPLIDDKFNLFEIFNNTYTS